MLREKRESAERPGTMSYEPQSFATYTKTPPASEGTSTRFRIIMGNDESSEEDVYKDIGAGSGAITRGIIGDEEEVLEMVGAKHPQINASATLETRPEARRMMRGTEDPT